LQHALANKRHEAEGEENYFKQQKIEIAAEKRDLDLVADGVRVCVPPHLPKPNVVETMSLTRVCHLCRAACAPMSRMHKRHSRIRRCGSIMPGRSSPRVTQGE
jgi:hypothetical protein